MSQTAESTQIIKTFVDDVAVVKMPVQEYKKLASNGIPYASEALYYTPRTLKMVMEKIGEPADRDINFYLQNGFIYLFPRSEKGIEYDLKLLDDILKL